MNIFQLAFSILNWSILSYWKSWSEKNTSDNIIRISYNYSFILSHRGHAHQTQDSNDIQIKKNRIPEVQRERTVFLINGAEFAGYLYGKEKAV